MVKFFQQHNNAMAMNVVVTSHLPVCLYSATGGKVIRQFARTR
jgi:SPX domain protein involved in polyphosphate accumulation